MIIDKNKNTTYYTHGFHPYPAKFTPQMVNKYLNLYCKGGYTILDPFCGSGTTLVEGVINSMNSVGIDLNPIAFIISKAKTNLYTKNDIIEAKRFIAEIELVTSKNSFSKWYQVTKSETIIPNIPNLNHWFQKNVSIELAILKKKLDEIKNLHIKDLMFCAFSKIIVKVSNQDSEVRYTAKNKNHPDGIVISLFIDTVKNYLKALNTTEYVINAKAEVHNADAYEVLKKYDDNHFDFVITSPPYINTFDYYLYHKQRMFWLGLDHRPVRKNEIGNHHRIDTKTFEIAKAEYIDSMTLVIDQLSRVSKTNSFFVMIIGDGIVNGITIDMSRVVTEICENSNYEIQQIESINLSDITRSFNRKFTNAPKKEHTIILKNRK